MTLGGWIMMIGTWSAVLTVNVLCIRALLRKRD